MLILSIDSGTKQSGFVVYDTEKQEILDKGILLNEELVEKVWTYNKGEQYPSVLVYEGMHLYHSVSQDTLETLMWIGEFRFAFRMCDYKEPCIEIKRSTIRKHFEVKNDSGIRVALIDRFGGSRSVAVGTKKQKGKLYGVKSHIWSALAVAIYYAETTGANSE